MIKPTKMTKAVLFLTLFFIGLKPALLQAQTYAGEITRDSIAFGEALVALAWKNYPQNDAYRLEVKQEDENITQAKWEWLENLNASFNLNEGNINPDLERTNIFFPPQYSFQGGRPSPCLGW